MSFDGGRYYGSATAETSLTPQEGDDEREPARVLLLMGQPIVLDLVTLTLSHGVCTVRTLTSAGELEATVEQWQPHVLILDMALDGLRIMQQLRNSMAGSGSRPLVIGLVSRGDLQGKLAAFDAGADDIMSTPFEPEELLARVIALTRRSSTDSIALAPVIKVGQLEIDILNHTVRAGDVQLLLTPLELGLLYLFAANPGRVLTREEIFDTLWGTNHGAAKNVVYQHIRSLRARLQTDGRQPQFVTTVAGRGYRFLPSGQTA